MAELTDAERVFIEALRTVRAKLMDTITGLDDTIAEVAQAAAARPGPGKAFGGLLSPTGAGVITTARQQQLDSIGTWVRDLPGGGVQLRQHANGQLVNVTEDGSVTFPIKDTPQA